MLLDNEDEADKGNLVNNVGADSKTFVWKCHSALKLHSWMSEQINQWVSDKPRYKGAIAGTNIYFQLVKVIFNTC